MTDVWSSAKIRQFEYVAAGPTMGLLRVSGKPPRRGTTASERPTLLVEQAGSVSRHAALPSPPDERGVLRAAFSVPPGIIDPLTRFSLEAADGAVIPLPAPTRAAVQPIPAAAPPRPAPVADPAPSAGSVPAPADEKHTSDLRRRLAELEAENVTLRREMDGARTAQARAESELEQLRATLEELEIWRGELERRLAATTTELGEARHRIQEGEGELQRMRDDHAEADARAAAAEVEAAALREWIAASGTGTDTPGDDRVRVLEAEREELARQAAELIALLDSVEQFTDPADGLEQARSQAAELHAAAESSVPPADPSTELPASDTRHPELPRAEEDVAAPLPAPADDNVTELLAAAEPGADSATADLAASADDRAAMLEELSRRAEERAEEAAARELSEAGSGGSRPGA